MIKNCKNCGDEIEDDSYEEYCCSDCFHDYIRKINQIEDNDDIIQEQQLRALYDFSEED